MQSLEDLDVVFGEVRRDWEQHEEALADADTSIELNPTSFKVYRTRGRCNIHLEKYEAAVSDFKSAIEYAESEGADGDIRALRTELKKAEVDLKRSKTKDYYKILGRCFLSQRHLTVVLKGCCCRSPERLYGCRHKESIPARIPQTSSRQGVPNERSLDSS